MPEEINRIETDSVSDYLFVTEPSGMTNLSEGGLPGKVFHVGTVMIDSLVQQFAKAKEIRKHDSFDLHPGDYFVGTFHHPSNVDTLYRLE